MPLSVTGERAIERSPAARAADRRRPRTGSAGDHCFEAAREIAQGRRKRRVKAFRMRAHPANECRPCDPGGTYHRHIFWRKRDRDRGSTWSVQDASNRFSALVEAARREPQTVTKHGKPAVYVDAAERRCQRKRALSGGGRGRSFARCPVRSAIFKASREMICLAAMMYVWFPLSRRNVEDLLFERGIDVSHETVRFRWNRFGPLFAAGIRKGRAPGGTL